MNSSSGKAVMFILSLLLVVSLNLTCLDAIADPAPCRQKYDTYLAELESASSSLSTFMKQNTTCLEAKNECEKCARLDDGEIACEPIGFECQATKSICTNFKKSSKKP